MVSVSRPRLLSSTNSCASSVYGFAHSKSELHTFYQVLVLRLVTLKVGCRTHRTPSDIPCPRYTVIKVEPESQKLKAIKAPSTKIVSPITESRALALDAL